MVDEREVLGREILAAMAWGARENGGHVWSAPRLGACIEARGQVCAPRVGVIRAALADLVERGQVVRVGVRFRRADAPDLT